METKTIAKVNNVDIVSTSDEQMVAIKPICKALGIDWEGQRQRIERDEILGSVACIIKATGKDGKSYEMIAVPYMFIFGWLFSIDVSKVNETAKESVLKYNGVLQSPVRPFHRASDLPQTEARDHGKESSGVPRMPKAFQRCPKINE